MVKEYPFPSPARDFEVQMVKMPKTGSWKKPSKMPTTLFKNGRQFGRKEKAGFSAEAGFSRVSRLKPS